MQKQKAGTEQAAEMKRVLIEALKADAVVLRWQGQALSELQTLAQKTVRAVETNAFVEMKDWAEPSQKNPRFMDGATKVLEQGKAQRNTSGYRVV